MQVIEKPIAEIKFYENNPRKNDAAVPKVAQSIKEFGFKVPVIIDKDGIIVAGHTRVKAAISLGMDSVPCVLADDLTEEQIKKFRLIDNKVAEFSEWDFDKLAVEMADLGDLTGFGFEQALEEPEPNPYTKKIKAPVYEPKEETAPATSELYNPAKSDELISDIEKANIPDDVRQFLIAASYRHIVFNYSRIAEFYCHASAEVQDLMEKSALVIIDYDKAIEYGFVTLAKRLDELLEADIDESE